MRTDKNEPASMLPPVKNKSSAAQLSGSENLGPVALCPHLSMGLPLTKRIKQYYLVILIGYMLSLCKLGANN